MPKYSGRKYLAGYLTVLVTLSGCLLTMPEPALAQSFGNQVGSPRINDNVNTGKSTYSRDKKKPSFLHRPVKESPSEQFAYAAEQEKKGRLKSAIDNYDDLVHEWHDSPEAVKAQYQIGLLLLKRHKYQKAFKAFQYMIDHFSGNFDYDKVLDYQLRIARQVMGDRWGDILFLPGFESPEKALPLFEQILKNAPDWSKAASVRLKMGLTYEQTHQYEDAIKAFDSIQQYNPQSPEAEDALYHKAYCLYTLAKKAPRDEKRCRQALAGLSAFITRYRMSPYRKQAETYLNELKTHLADMYYNRAVFYDKAHKIEAAIITYDNFLSKFPGSEKAQQAYNRVKVLKSELKNKQVKED